jgi:hypothetical protein
MATERHSKVSFFDGTNWSKPVSLDQSNGGLVDIDCPNVNFCTVLEGLGYVRSWHRNA